MTLSGKVHNNFRSDYIRNRAVCQQFSDIRRKSRRFFLDCRGDIRFFVYRYIIRVGKVGGHFYKRIFYYSGGVVTYSKFEKQDFFVPVFAEKLSVSFICRVPARVFRKTVVAAEICRQRFSADGTSRYEFFGDFHIFLLRNHSFYRIFVFVCPLPARLGTLEKPVVALNIKKPFFVKARFLKAMVDVCCDNEMVFVLYKRQKRGENFGFRDIFIAVY